MFISIIKTALIYFCIVLAMRLMGKKQAGQLQPYELVITLMIAEVAAKPMDGPETPIAYGLIPALTLMLLYFLFTFLTLKSVRLRSLLCGRPNILIHDGKILYHELRRSNYSLSDLLEQLRIFGNTCIPEIHYAILETNGVLSVMPYPAHCPVTPEQLSMNIQEENLFLCVIMDGIANLSELKRLKLSEDTMRHLLNQHGYSRDSEILLFMLSDNGDYFIQDKHGHTHSSCGKEPTHE